MIPRGTPDLPQRIFDRPAVFVRKVLKSRGLIKNQENRTNPQIRLDRQTHRAISSPHRTWVARRSLCQGSSHLRLAWVACFYLSSLKCSGRCEHVGGAGGMDAVTSSAAPIRLDQVVRLSRTQDAIGIVEPRLICIVHRLPVLSALSSAPLGHVLTGSFFFVPTQTRLSHRRRSIGFRFDIGIGTVKTIFLADVAGSCSVDFVIAIV